LKNPDFTQTAFRAASEHHRPQKAEYTQLLQREFDTRLREVGQRTARPSLTNWLGIIGTSGYWSGFPSPLPSDICSRSPAASVSKGLVSAPQSMQIQTF
jgi:hypothetical protein